MLRQSKNTKGNKTQDKGVILFYTKEAYPSQEKISKDNDNSIKVIEEYLVLLTLKIDKSKEKKQDEYL